MNTFLKMEWWFASLWDHIGDQRNWKQSPEANSRGQQEGCYSPGRTPLTDSSNEPVYCDKAGCCVQSCIVECHVKLLPGILASQMMPSQVLSAPEPAPCQENRARWLELGLDDFLASGLTLAHLLVLRSLGSETAVGRFCVSPWPSLCNSKGRDERVGQREGGKKRGKEGRKRKRLNIKVGYTDKFLCTFLSFSIVT